MFNLAQLQKIVDAGSKRVGRGKRGARGAKSGRGTKGSLKRGKMPLNFEGGALPMTKRLPMLRGKSKNKPVSPRPVIIDFDVLNQFKANAVITPESLVKAGFFDAVEVRTRGVKILSRGKLKKKVKVENIAMSNSAKKIIEEESKIKA
ncbi:MAG: 50S ribosomal protein L15 [bacterium]|nr:50S ribosomal protein L15 [bacterium]